MVNYKYKIKKKHMNIVSSFMDADHVYLDKLLVLFLNKQNNPDNSGQAVDFFQNFKDHLLSHIELENNFLFPRFDEFTGVEPGSGPTAVAIRDHENIIKLLKSVEEALLAKEVEKVIRIGGWLQSAMKKHMARETEIHYPVGDHFIMPDEWIEVIERTYGENLEKLKINFKSTKLAKIYFR